MAPPLPITLNVAGVHAQMDVGTLGLNLSRCVSQAWSSHTRKRQFLVPSAAGDDLADG